MEAGLAAPALLSVDPGSATDQVQVSASYGVNLSNDAQAFSQSLEKAAGVEGVEKPSKVAEMMFEPLDFINNEAKSLASYAENAIQSGNELTPSEIVTLTTRSQEFMFYAQLTSNVANRTADGLQQLFRQQS